MAYNETTLTKGNTMTIENNTEAVIETPRRKKIVSRIKKSAPTVAAYSLYGAYVGAGVASIYYSVKIVKTQLEIAEVELASAKANQN
jgi:hypothetical protein